MSDGDHEIEVRAVSGDMHSLPSYANVHGLGNTDSEFSAPPLVIALVVGVFFVWCASLLFVRFRSDEEIDGLLSRVRRPSEDFLDAEIVLEDKSGNSAQ